MINVSERAMKKASVSRSRMNLAVKKDASNVVQMNTLQEIVQNPLKEAVTKLSRKIKSRIP